MIIIGIYVDNCLIIGKEESAENLINELKNHEFNLKFERNVNEYLIDELKNLEFDLKIERNVNKYLSCCIEESKDEGKLTMMQLHLLTRSSLLPEKLNTQVVLKSDIFK
jgi:hypothetical protein